MDMNSIGSIAVFLTQSFNNLSPTVSGNAVIIVDMARQHVANYCGVDIGSNSIQAKYQPPIISFAKADLIDFVNAQGGGESISLGELSINDSGEVNSSQSWRSIGEQQLKALGKPIYFTRVTV